MTTIMMFADVNIAISYLCFHLNIINYPFSYRHCLKFADGADGQRADGGNDVIPAVQTHAGGARALPAQLLCPPGENVS